MKNFSKKLSFVMATAMVVTSLYAPQGTEAAAANKIVVANSTKAVKSKNIYLGGKTVDFDAIIKGKKNVKGTWKSSNKSIATVDKNGVVKGLKNGQATITFTSKKTKKAKAVKVQMKVNVRTRASKMMLTPAAVMVKEGAKAEVMASFDLSKKVKAAGGKETTYKLFAESSDEKVAKATVEGSKIMVEGVAHAASPVSITVYAAQVESLAKAKEVTIKLTKTFEVKVNSKLDAKQSGANKITVMGSDLVASKSAFVVKNSSGVVLPLKDMITVNEAKNEAVLEGDTTQIPVGKYTLSYNNSDPVEFEVVEAVVKSIEIMPTGKAIMAPPVNNNNVVKNAYAYYRVLNQFKEDITKTPLAANIQVSGSDSPVITKKGKIEFTSTSINGYQLNLSQISLAIVDTKTGVNANAILTAGEAAKVSKTEYKGLFNLTTRKVVESITDGDKLANYAVLFTGTDQYGNTLVEDKNKGDIQVNLLSITGVSTDSNRAKVITVGNDDYYAFTLKGTQNKVDETADRPGAVEVQSIAIRSGFIEKNKFEVMSATKVDTLNVRAGALGVYENQDNELEFDALDANGKKITSWDVLKKLNNTKNLPNNTNANVKLRFVKNADGKVVLMYHPGNDVVGSNLDTASITQVLSFISDTNKFSATNINVRKARKPVSIIGIESDTVRGTTATKNHNEFVIKAEKIKFQDQYGNLIKADDFKTGYKVKVILENTNLNVSGGFRKLAASDQAIVSDTSIVTLAGNGTKVVEYAAAHVDAASGSGVAKVTVKLLNDAVDEDKFTSSEAKSFEIYNARLQDMSGFAINDPGVRPASNLDTQITNPNVAPIENSDKGFEPGVVGYYAGEKISLKKKDDFAVFGATDANPTFAPVPTIDPNLKSKVDNKTGVRVIINDGKASQAEREFTYSNEARKVAKVEMGKTAMSVTDGTPQTWALIKVPTALDVKVKDQYGALSAVEPYITYTDFDDNEVEIKDNGRKTATVVVKEHKTATLTVKFSFPGSTYTFEKTIKITRP